MPELEKRDVSTSTDEILSILRRDGALILTNVLSAAELEQVRAETMPYIEATPNGADMFVGHNTTRTGALVARSAKCREMITHPTILAAANEFLKPFCEKIQLHLTQVIRIKPGQTAQGIHRDRWAWGTHLKFLEPQFNTIWAISDFTKANGATQVCPGSLDWEDTHEVLPEEIGYAEMPAGSVLVYSGGVFHGGGANVSNGDRVGINLTYTLGWLRQEENQYLSCPPEIAKTLPRDLQELIGYSLGGYALGYYTPPGAPGEAPESVPPEYALGHHETAISTLGSAELLESISTEIRGEKARA